MDTLKIIFFTISATLLLIAAVFHRISFVLKHCPDKTGKTFAKLKDANHRKNVPVYGRRYGGPIRQIGTIKHLTKAKYAYCVQGKEYIMRSDYFGTAKQTPYTCPIVYLKKNPKIAFCPDILISGDKNFMLTTLCFFTSVSFFVVALYL